MRSVSPTVEVLAAILQEVPGVEEDIRARREMVLAAAASFEPSRNPVSAAVGSCVAALRARSAEMRRAAPAAHPTEPRPELAFHERATMAVPPPSETAKPKDSAPVHWGVAEGLLYEDVLNLFALGDQAGAMTSLERLIMLCPHAEELATFLEKNGELLRKLYEEHLGTLDRVPVPIRDARPVKIPTPFAPIVLDVLKLADGHRPLRDILKRSKLGDVQTLASVAHLARSGFLELA
ncbi:MAG: hypothetical protein FJ087_18025 [Deltaproteobacteria bacterium]|nr:hypothetical protein [Deltaproteobacteria bacterium]